MIEFETFYRNGDPNDPVKVPVEIARPFIDKTIAMIERTAWLIETRAPRYEIDGHSAEIRAFTKQVEAMLEKY